MFKSRHSGQNFILSKIKTGGILLALFLLFAASAFAFPPGVLPDPALTPGVVDPAVTQGNIHSTICVNGYAAAHRHVTIEEKKEALARYRHKYPKWHRPPYEFDHLISLELGGANDINNLWPEPMSLPSPSGRGAGVRENLGARAKDQVEDYLHRQVCAGRIPLKDAQKEIRADWTKVYKEMKHGK